MMNFKLTLPIRVAVISVESLKVTKEKEAFEQFRICTKNYKEKYGHLSAGKVPGIQNARRLFRAMKIEPTRYRPSSEALLHRVLREKSLYHVNTLVDISNWCALDFLLPNGIYDAEKLNGDIELRQGEPGESYIGLNNREVNLKNRYALCDETGPFGSPITDSKRTSIGLDTNCAITVIYAPQDFDPELLHQQGKIYADRIISICGGKLNSIALYG